MAGKMRLLARCPTPPSTDSSPSGKTTGRLPTELVSEQLQRLALFSAIIGGLWTYGLLMDLVIVPLFLKDVVAHFNHSAPIEVSAIVLSVLMARYLRYSPHTPERKTTVGLVYMVVNGVGIGILNNW